MEQSQSSSRQDAACARCRERKVRCGREKPQCKHCKLDGVDCEYSLPEKRINHTKLLCRNFDRLEDRLNSIEGELSWLTAMLKAGQKGGLDLPTREPVQPDTTTDAEQGNATLPVPTDRQVVRGHGDCGDQFHGPGTLLSLCHAFKKKVVATKILQQPSLEHSSPSSSDDESISAIQSEAIRELLNQTCLTATLEPPLEICEPTLIRLPPKQMLLMVLSQFFQNADYSTDLFELPFLTRNIERVYSEPFSPAKDAWAICFNVIILLVLGSESSTHGDDSLMGSQFSLPFFRAMRAALDQAQLLMTPKLVNVQALALLSVAAQRYYSRARAVAIFAQACLLARLTGLHQATAVPDGLSHHEVQERYKTYVSLHLRDKSLSLFWNSICWLPSFDRSLPLRSEPSMFVDSKIAGRVALAEIQEQLYRHFHSANGSSSTPQAMTEMACIIRDLERWALCYGSFSLPFASSHEAELQLTYLATRVLAFSKFTESERRQQALGDAKASCLTLLVAYDKHDQSAFEMLEAIRSARGPSSISGHGERSRGNSPEKPSETSSRLGSLLDAFPAHAFFLLAEDVIWPRTGSLDSSHVDNLKLLRDVHACFHEVNMRTQSNNYGLQVERTFAHLLDIINLIQHPELAQTPLNSASHCSNDDIPLPQGCNAPAQPLLTPGLFGPSGTLTNWEFPFEAVASLDEIDDEQRSRKRPRMDDFSLDDVHAPSEFLSGLSPMDLNKMVDLETSSLT